MKIISTNRRAYFNYEILETIEAGIVLKGDEVKSVRDKQISITDAFATIHQGNMVLTNCHIAPYTHAYTKGDTTRRSRRLLMHKGNLTSWLVLSRARG